MLLFFFTSMYQLTVINCRASVIAVNTTFVLACVFFNMTIFFIFKIFVPLPRRESIFSILFQLNLQKKYNFYETLCSMGSARIHYVLELSWSSAVIRHWVDKSHSTIVGIDWGCTWRTNFTKYQLAMETLTCIVQ